MDNRVALSCFAYRRNKGSYRKCIIKNPIKDKYIIKDLSPEEFRKSVMELLAFGGEDIIQVLMCDLRSSHTLNKKGAS